MKAILDNWESGDLASAVNLAESWRDDVMTVFPDFDWTDNEADDIDTLDRQDRAQDPAVMAAERMSRAELMNAAREGQALGTCDED